MALSAELEALISELEKVDPAGAKDQRALLEKYPSLQKATQEQRLRQSDYDKRLNEMKSQVEYGKTMKNWADENVPKFEQMKKEREEALAAKEKLEADLQKKIEEATKSAAAASGVDPDKLADAVRLKIGGDFVSKSELAKITSDEMKKMVEGEVAGARKTFYDVDVPKMAGLNSALTEAQLRFANEFKGEYLDAEAYVAFVAKVGDQFFDKEKGKFDRQKAYDEFVRVKRAEVSSQAEIEKRAQARADEILKARGIDGGFPGTSGIPTGPGPLQMRFNAKAKEDPLFGAPVELGDGSAAAAAAAELHGEGK
jgi:hypothetical protein